MSESEVHPFHVPTNHSSTNILNRARNTTINRAEFNNVGGDLVRNFHTTITSPHDILWDAIAGVGASHNSGLQFTRGSCLPGTREAVLQDIHEWNASEQSSPVCWLSGPAGAGKSAIALTVANSCAENKGLAASFFFFRSDPKRNQPTFLMLTIAYGLITTRPSLRHLVNRRIATDPSVLEATLEHQFRELIARPLLEKSWWTRVRELLLRRLNRTATRYPNLVIIDGLDECNDSGTQRRIISILTSAFQKYTHFPLRLLICSRPESWIRDAFNLPNIHAITKQIILDDLYSPDKDIEWYLLHEFQSICTDSKYSQVVFPHPWPSDADIQHLVRRASGQFIYAVTVIKFVKTEYSHPFGQLRMILNNSSHQLGGSQKSPFIELDNLYHLILSSNPERDKLLSILSAIIILQNHRLPSSPEFIELLLGFPPGEVDLSLRAMHSVLDIRGRRDHIRVYHTSFTDYLDNESRSAEFYIDKPKEHNALASQWLRSLVEQCKPPYNRFIFGSSIEILFVWWSDFCSHIENPSPRLLYDLQNVDVLDLLAATSLGSSLSSQTASNSSVKSRPYWSCWPSVVDCFQTASDWLERVGGAVDESKIIKYFVDLQDRFCPSTLLDTQTRKDLTFWMILNLTNCRWECSLTRRIDTSALRLLVATGSHNSGHSPFSLRQPDNGDTFRDNCLQVALCLGNDLKTSVQRLQALETPGKSGDLLEIEGIVSNLLDSTLLRSCGPVPELLSTFETISDAVKASLGRDWINENYSRRVILNNLLPWCTTFPIDSRRVLKNQILNLFSETDPRQISTTAIHKYKLTPAAAAYGIL
ncbi:hypothetical protein L218DRAFT_1081575 [Marasmius fiardii PR-910]|nr:hypothetical protein L218DRAFT_1081575 [Marasmius fiardii PR-910]